MRITRPWLNAARTWYDLTRHEGDDPPAGDPPKGPPADPPEPSDDPDPEGADKLGDPGKQALDRMKAERAAAKKEAADAKKALADLSKRVAEFEDRDKSELDKATARADRAEKVAQAATARAVAAEVKALAAGQFADPSDAVLLGDLGKYVGADGAIDAEGIQSDLADLLERKPHLRKQTTPADPPKPKAPRPDPSQGSGRGGDKPVDFRTASREDFEAELAKYGARLR